MQKEFFLLTCCIASLVMMGSVWANSENTKETLRKNMIESYNFDSNSKAKKLYLMGTIKKPVHACVVKGDKPGYLGKSQDYKKLTTDKTVSVFDTNPAEVTVSVQPRDKAVTITVADPRFDKVPDAAKSVEYQTSTWLAGGGVADNTETKSLKFPVSKVSFERTYKVHFQGVRTDSAMFSPGDYKASVLFTCE